MSTEAKHSNIYIRCNLSNDHLVKIDKGDDDKRSQL